MIWNFLLVFLLLFDNQALQRKTITFFIAKRMVNNTWVESLKKIENVAPELGNVAMLLRERLSVVENKASSSSTVEDRCLFSCPRRTP